MDGKKPGPEAETLHYDIPWEAAIDKALSKKRPVGGFPKPPSRTIRPKRVPPSPKPEKPKHKVRAEPLPDPLDEAAKRRKPTKAEIQAEMLRAHCTRPQAIARLKSQAGD
jgi:hypothetical protein